MVADNDQALSRSCMCIKCKEVADQHEVVCLRCVEKAELESHPILHRWLMTTQKDTDILLHEVNKRTVDVEAVMEELQDVKAKLRALENRISSHDNNREAHNYE